MGVNVHTYLSGSLAVVLMFFLFGTTLVVYDEGNLGLMLVLAGAFLGFITWASLISKNR
jgi:hypothetical protein